MKFLHILTSNLFKIHFLYTVQGPSTWICIEITAFITLNSAYSFSTFVPFTSICNFYLMTVMIETCVLIISYRNKFLWQLYIESVVIYFYIKTWVLLSSVISLICSYDNESLNMGFITPVTCKRIILITYPYPIYDTRQSKPVLVTTYTFTQNILYSCKNYVKSK